MIKLYFNSRIRQIKEEAGKAAVEDYKRSVSASSYNEIERLLSDCSVMFDFNNPTVNVFSIERTHMGTFNEQTIIGYFIVGDSKVHQWYLFCSRKHHNELVAKYSRKLPTVIRDN